ncbi:MAG: choice-of-anchor D domain-containing protein, partial [Fidelibacterota bacterium]
MNSNLGNYSLQWNSPCIDAGDPDLDGDGITWESDPDDRDPDGTRMDMGAFYFDQSDSIFHFTPVPPTGLPYNIVIDTASINDNGLLPGDSIGVFDGDLCVGATAITGSSSNLNLVAWQADTTYGLAGFTPGNPMTFKILSSLYGYPEVFTPTATFTVGNGTFGSGTYSVVDLVVTTTEVPVLTPQQSSILFGSVPIWTTGLDTLEIYNAGDRNLIISSIQSDQPVFTTNFSAPAMVAPGDTLLVPLAFTPDMIAYFTGNLTIESNDASHSPATITLTGLGTQSLAPDMTGFDWTMNLGAAISGDTIAIDWTFQNAGNDTLRLTNIWTDDWHFFVSTTQCQVAPGDFYTLPIFFTPDGKGLFSTNLNFSHNDPTLPQNWIQLTGVGYDGHFQSVAPTGLPYSVLTDTIIVDNQFLDIGDEIGIFDGTQCVGVGIQGLDSTLQITAWQADPAYGLAGFTPGNAMSFSFWGNTYGVDREIPLAADYLQGDGTFGFSPLTLVNLTGSSGFTPDLAVDTTVLYFDPTNVGASTGRVLYLANTGSAPLQIANVQSSSGVFSPNQTSLTLPTGTLDSITVTFAPYEPVFYTATLTIQSDDPQSPLVAVPLQGMGIPSLQSHLTLPNPTVTFSPTVVGDTTTLQVPIRNDGNRDLAVYSVNASNAAFQASIQPTTIPPGGVELFQLSFTPLAKGREAAVVQVNSDADNGNTHYLSASGVGYEGFFQPVQPTGLPYTVVVDSIITGSDSSLKVGDEIGVYDDLLCVGAGVVEEVQDSARTGSFYFDGNAGAQDYVETTIYGFDPTVGSIELWVKVIDAPTNDIPLMSITQNNNWSPQAFHLMYRAGGTIHHHTYNNGWTGEWNINNQWQYNTWHHVALTWNGNNRKIYLDGNLVGENNNYVQPNIDPNSYTMRIGDNPDGSYLHGYIDEFRLWSVELTQGEIQDRLSTTLTGSENGLVGYWPIGFSTNQYIIDQSGNGNTGQIFGDITLSQDTPPLNYTEGELASLQIVTWEQDLAHGLPGFTSGNPMAFLVRTDLDSLPDSTAETREGIATFIQGDGYFGTGNFSVLNLTVGEEIDASFFYGSVSGTVLSNKGGPVVGAEIQLFQGAALAETASSDSAGFFFMDSIPSGEYTLSVRRFHYNDTLISQPFTVQKPDTTHLDLTLTQIENMVFLVPAGQPTIQAAISLTLDHDTVLVDPGTYQENINFNGKNIVLRSTSGPETTIIDGNQNGSVVTFESGEDS